MFQSDCCQRMCRSLKRLGAIGAAWAGVIAGVVAGGFATSSAQAQTAGACCRPSTAGGCVIVTPQQCQQFGGLFVGGTSCAPCDQGGFCCVNNNCTQVPLAGACLSLGGTFYPTAALCASNCGTAASGACCDPATGACIVTPPSQCAAPRVFYTGLSCNPSPCVPTGACCLQTACISVTQAQCDAQGGTWFANTTCTAVACGPTGACCNPVSGGCVISTQTNCPAPNQFFPGQPCIGVPCHLTVVCCLPTGQCVLTSLTECDAIGGTVNTSATSCQPSPCFQTGACCRSGTCTVVPVGQCPAGLPFFPGQACTPTIVCPPNTGACCLQTACIVVPQSQCPTSAVFVPNASCVPNPCPAVGACCVPGAACFITTQSACGGTWYPSGGCTPDPCVQTGACCTAAGGCAITTQTQCGSSTFFPGGTCTPNPCPVGGCCDPCTGRCYFTTQVDCVKRGGNYLGNGVACTPRNCRPLIGACCNRITGACFLTTQSQCRPTPVGIFSWFGGSTCAPNPCRRSDFNGDSVTSVQDIFDFLQAWFGGN